MAASGWRWLGLRPSLQNLWVSHRPSSWSCGPPLWTNLARSNISLTAEPSSPGGPPAPTSGVERVYLPPVEAAFEEERDAWAGSLLNAGVDIVLQLRQGERVRLPAGVTGIVDLLPIQIAGDSADLEIPEAPVGFLWPLIPGLADREGLLDGVCERLAAAGALFLHAVRPDLGSFERRRLVEMSGEDKLFEAVFHGTRVSESDFLSSCRQHGLRAFAERPGAGTRDRRGRNLSIAAMLEQAAETWLALGRPETQGHSLYRAARWAESCHVDIEALAREGNLAVVAELKEPAVELIEEWAAGRRRDGFDLWTEGKEISR